MVVAVTARAVLLRGVRLILEDLVEHLLPDDRARHPAQVDVEVNLQLAQQLSAQVLQGRHGKLPGYCAAEKNFPSKPKPWATSIDM